MGTTSEITLNIREPFDTLARQEFELDNYDSSCVDLTFHTSMALPFGTINNRPSGWVAVEGKIGGQPAVGYGEGATLPKAVFTDDYGDNIADNMRQLLECIGEAESASFKDILGLNQSHQFIDGGHYPTARLAVEMALVDMLGKVNDIPVAQLIGIPETITEVAYGKSIGAVTVAAIKEQTIEAVAQNARKIKLKVTPDSFYEVTAAIEQLRSDFPDLDYMVDANGSFDPSNPRDVKKLQSLDLLGLVMIEEPCSRVGRVRGIASNQLLRQKLTSFETPICLDDCLQTFEQCVWAVESELAQIINIKPGRLGSFIRSLDLIDWVADNDGQVMVGGMIEATPGRCMTSILGAYCANKGFTVPGDLSLAQERLAEDLVDASQQLKLSTSGNIILPLGSGWGFDV